MRYYFLFYCFVPMVFILTGCSETVVTERVSRDVLKLDRLDKVLVHDLGIITAKSFHRELYRYKNNSDETLKISHFAASCSCVVPEITDRVVPPDGFVEVTMGYQAPNRTTNSSQIVLVHFVNKGIPPLKLELKSSTRSAISISPEKLSWKLPLKEKGAGLSFTVENYSDSFWSAIDFKTNSTWLEVSVIETTEYLEHHSPKQSWRCFAIPKMDQLVCGITKANLVVYPTNLAELAQTIPVEVNIVTPICVIPDTVFSSCVVSESEVGEVALEIFDQLSEYSLTEEDFVVSCQDKAVKCSISRNEGSNKLNLVVSFDRSQSRTVSDSIVLEISQRNVRLQIPVLLIVKSSPQAIGN